MITTQIADKIFQLNPDNFVNTALQYYRHQCMNSPFYRQYLEIIAAHNVSVESLTQIPFLPIQFFKTHRINTEQVALHRDAKHLYFESSGTTGQVSSHHEVPDSVLYEKSFGAAFDLFYGDVSEYCICALLPSYLERGHSSLVYMCDRLIKNSRHPASNFYLYDHKELYHCLQSMEASAQKTLLIGVTYALLDFAEAFPVRLQHTLVMETGGMKGRRREMIREEVHAVLREQFNVPSVHAEYGMTELLSQAYSAGDGLFKCPPWMKVLVRDVNDPFQISEAGRGVLNIIDLANIHSCCFIATDDVGEVMPDGSFTVKGRLDLSDLRGCSLMYES